MSPALAIWSGRSRRRASVRYLRRGFMAHPTTPSTMKATSHNRISTAIQSIRLIEKDLLWNTALHDFQIQLEAPTTKENKMKTTLTLITIITSLFFSACANNNRAEYWNARRAAIGSLPPNQGTQAQIDPMRHQYVKTMTQAQIDQMRDDYVKKMLLPSDGHNPGSSQRFKTEIKPMEDASEALFALKPVTFRYKHDIDPDPAQRFGLVAEEVEKVKPDLVVCDQEGRPNVVRYDSINAMLLNEFLKEHKKVEEQGATITELKKEIGSLTATVKEQAAQIQKVSAQVEMSKPTPKVVTNMP
ncbi:MAG: hypothetical protein DME62_08830 [Verrucomicrobia bacterium]|nr:MAG: hypothetical protein DME62_08830 [Verrucomicrobiota bacterium]